MTTPTTNVTENFFSKYQAVLEKGHFGWRGRKLVKLTRGLNRELGLGEKNPQDAGVLRVAQAAQTALGQYKSRAARREFRELNRRVVALKYRDGGQDPVAAAEIAPIEVLAQRWKDAYELYQNKPLCELEKAKLREAVRYPEFVKLLDADKHLRDAFFKWALRDNCGVAEFVQFPSTVARLKHAHMAGMVGRFAKKFPLMPEGGEKTVQLPFEVEAEDGTLSCRMISILDEEQTVTLRGGNRMSIKQVLDGFAAKNGTPGQFSFFGKHGITHWDPHNLRWWDARIDGWRWIDTSRNNWWEALPVFESLSLETVRERYGVGELEAGQWVAVAKNSRESVSTDIDKSHGYMDVLIPDGAGGYRLYPTGKFAKEFPSSFFARVMIIGNTVEARIQFPDENSFYSHRQHGMTPFILTPEQGTELMRDVGRDIDEARAGNVIFQLAWENCAWWPQNKLDKLLGPEKYGGPVPNMYLASFFDSQPKVQPLKSVARFAQDKPKVIQDIVLFILKLLFQSWKGVYVDENGRWVFKSVDHSNFRGNSCIPAIQCVKIQNRTLRGKVIFGNMFLEQGV